MVKLQLKSLALGFFLAWLIPIIGFFILVQYESDKHSLVRETTLASGKIVKIISCHLVWGIEHDERDTSKDSFALEYVSTIADTDEPAVDKETQEVFELIRPFSEQWRFNSASVSAFPTTERKGKFYIYNFKRDSDGTWKFERTLSKVFVND